MQGHRPVPLHLAPALTVTNMYFILVCSHIELYNPVPSNDMNASTKAPHFTMVQQW